MQIVYISSHLGVREDDACGLKEVQFSSGEEIPMHVCLCLSLLSSQLPDWDRCLFWAWGCVIVNRFEMMELKDNTLAIDRS